MASVFAASAATAALIASVHASYAGEAAAIAALIALGLTVLLGLVSVATMIVALARREGYLALSALVFVALTLGVLIMAPAIVLALT